MWSIIALILKKLWYGAGLASQLAGGLRSLSWNGLCGFELWQHVRTSELLGRKTTSLHHITASSSLSWYCWANFTCICKLFQKKLKSGNFWWLYYFFAFLITPFHPTFVIGTLWLFKCQNISMHTFIYFFINHYTSNVSIWKAQDKKWMQRKISLKEKIIINTHSSHCSCNSVSIKPDLKLQFLIEQKFWKYVRSFEDPVVL